MNNNNVVVISMLIDKTRHANNIDIKRPILDFEILFCDNDHSEFSKIPVLLTDNAMARSASGMNIGELFIISGKIRSDKEEIYIEANAISRIDDGRRKKTSIEDGRIDLLRFNQKSNLATITGEIVEFTPGGIAIDVPREELSRGDLQNNDAIVIRGEIEGLQLKVGDNIVCVGKISTQYIKAEVINIIK